MLNQLLDTVKLAAKCLLAQWFGRGKTADFCGDCWKCNVIRWALLLSSIVSIWCISPMSFLVVLFIWVTYSAVTGKGWAGNFLHSQVIEFWNKNKKK